MLQPSGEQFSSVTANFGSELLHAAIAGTDSSGRSQEKPLLHIAELPPRQGRRHDWPRWAEPAVVRAFTERGISAPWSHQAQAAELAHDGRHVVISTGTEIGRAHV